MRVDQDKLTRDLTDAGFEREDIYNALMWLEKLADYQEGLVEPMQLCLLYTSLPNAAPMITPTAKSTTFPRIANSRNSFKKLILFSLCQLTL